LRDLQMAQAHHHPSHVSPENAEARNPGGSSGLVNQPWLRSHSRRLRNQNGTRRNH
jgi:hypothetical protein